MTMLTPDAAGAVDLRNCPTRDRWRRCRCGCCAVCGWPKHTSLHGPAFGQPPGSKPWDHQFVPVPEVTADAVDLRNCPTRGVE